MHKNKNSALRGSSIKSKLGVAALAASAMVVPAFADAADVTGAITGVAADASAGVTAGVTIGAVVFGARVVWGAIKSMAH